MSLARTAVKALAKAPVRQAVPASAYAASQLKRDQSTTSVPNFSAYRCVHIC
jgi:hypothetical protein